LPRLESGERRGKMRGEMRRQIRGQTGEKNPRSRRGFFVRLIANPGL